MSMSSTQENERKDTSQRVVYGDLWHRWHRMSAFTTEATMGNASGQHSLFLNLPHQARAFDEKMETKHTA
jgi:hypothetical protein